ncbi:MAG: hypothetical protein KAS32_05750 [Candidatus Peribacteraceae bacterium]|nr:hypothetical protein [Candidatus Peribacteraceae bacterium]
MNRHDLPTDVKDELVKALHEQNDPEKIIDLVLKSIPPVDGFEVLHEEPLGEGCPGVCAMRPCRNPFHHDAYHMGTKMGSNLYIMHENHSDSVSKYLILVNTETGKKMRIRIHGE